LVTSVQLSILFNYLNAHHYEVNKLVFTQVFYHFNKELRTVDLRMRSSDTIIARIIFAFIVGLGLASFFHLFNLFQQYGQLLLLIEILIFLITFITTIIQIRELKHERILIHSQLDELQSSGIKIFRKKYERLLYSRDVADLPKITRLLFNFNTLAIVQPISHSEIRQIVRLCENFNIPIIPRGTGTGGYGGVLPTKNGIILNLFRLNSILELDKDNLIIETESGVTWRRLREYLKLKGFDVPVYPSSAPSSTVGGWFSSGGYGIGSSKFGEISKNVIEVTLIGTQGENVIFENAEKITGHFGSLGVVWKIKLKIIKISKIHHLAVAPKTLDDGLEVFNELQNHTPYFMRYLDQKNIDWVRNKDTQSISDICESKNGLIAVSYHSAEWESHDIKNVLKPKPIQILSDSCAQELWEDRFYTIRLKRKGPSLIIGEVLVPTTNLIQFLKLLNSWFKSESFTFELVSTQEGYSVVIVWFPADQRKYNLPVIGSIPYLFSWFRTFQVIRLAWSVEGTTYNNGGLWLSTFPKKENEKHIDFIKQKKSQTDPRNIFNPGKIISPRIPRFFPIIPWSLSIKIGLPIIGFLYRFVPKRIR
jgi:FAD/FMN-containing dehydrogenase